MTTVLLTLAVSAVLALILGFLLGFFKKIFYVPVDPTVEAIREVLPGANCGGCGFPGCDGFAAAVAKGEAPVDGCSAGGVNVAKAVGKVLGIEANAVANIALCACQGAKDVAATKGFYNGVQSCRAVKLSINGDKLCSFGCIGLGDCVSVCKFGALSIGENGLPVVDAEKCTGCGMCVKECPQKLFSKVPATRKGAVALCSNRNPLKAQIMKHCKKGCIKCGKCERGCPEKAITLENGIPVIDYTKCTSCGECVQGCPTKVLVLLENR